jgi:fructose-specific PTS system IIA-like component
LPLDFSFTCALASGLHARPASRLAEAAQPFQAACVLSNERSGAVANVKSVLAVLAADVSDGDRCRIRVDGPDEIAAVAALRTFVERDLPRADDPPATARTETTASGVRLPRVLARSSARYSVGLAVSSGIGVGEAVLVRDMAWPADIAQERAGDPVIEQGRVTRAIALVEASIRALQAHGVSGIEAAILGAHAAIVADVSLAETIAARVAAGRSAGHAVIDAGELFAARLRGAANPALRERAADIQDICRQVLDALYGRSASRLATRLTTPSVIVAETLSPQQLLAFDRQWVSGLVLENAGTTSHTVILARSFGIPAIVGVPRVTRTLAAAEPVIVDGHRGLVVTHLTPETRRFYDHERRRRRSRQAALARVSAAPALTVDGRRIEVGANVSSAEELGPARGSGADGIGLFRTELLFSERSDMPSEDTQYRIYVEAVGAMAGRPVIVRTMDLGGDKPVTSVTLPPEPNPFLGYRGVRTYPDNQDLVRAQLRAIARASAYGRIQLLLPMVSSIEEVLWVKALVAEVQDELGSAGFAFDPAMPLGIMMEVPAVSFMLDRLAAEVDFFSIGTNDLCQYFFAADRGNAKVAGLTSVTHPGFLRFLKQIVDQIRRLGKWVGMCGEMAGDVRLLPLLVGLGLDEVSASVSQIPALKDRISRLSAADCEAFLARALACDRSDEVEALVDGARSIERPRPLVEPELVRLDGECASKEEAIRALVDAFYVGGRTEEPHRIEEAVWMREAQYSTGLGHGIAVPHCKTDAVTSDSIGVLKLRAPIEWGSLDGEPVRMVLLLATRESNIDGRHLKVFSRLARKLMDQGFREQLFGVDDAMGVIHHLSGELEMAI